MQIVPASRSDLQRTEKVNNGSLSIVNVGNQKVAKIQLQNGMIRYASDRFLEIELVVNTQSGLKIPVSSIVTKEFYLIPRDFLAKGDNGEGRGFIREVDNRKGSPVTEFVEAVIYKEIDEDGNGLLPKPRQIREGTVMLTKKPSGRTMY